MATQAHPYDGLTPDTILTAVESLGWRCDGRLLALNSYENRVYQVGLDEAEPLVVKFYRPKRWSDAAIAEEHAFAFELDGHELPVVAPLEVRGRSLHRHEDFRFAAYPRRGGHWPEFSGSDDRERIGRLIGRIHGVGRSGRFRHRPRLDPVSFGAEPVAFVKAGELLPGHVRSAWESLADDLLAVVEARFAAAGRIDLLRIHGDCHPGNILWTDAGAHFVDLDDCLTGPAIQDLWMLISGERSTMARELGEILDGYTQFADFNGAEIGLIEPLRTLRMLHYCAWLARRRDDPAFVMAFPWFGTVRYWEEQVLALREQQALLQEPPLVL